MGTIQEYYFHGNVVIYIMLLGMYSHFNGGTVERGDNVAKAFTRLSYFGM